MSFKEHIVSFWLRNFDNRRNQKALKRYIKTSERYHKGGKLNVALAILESQRNSRLYGCEIYPSANLGKGLRIPHFVGIVIGSTSEIGENCTIFPGVVFGAAYSPNRENPKGRRHPKCGSNCIFGANSSIIGDIIIGNNVTVGAGAVVTKDIPDNVTVIGNNVILRNT